MNKCLVTGGCGFIGSNLALQLVKEGWQVDIVDDLSSGDLSFLDVASPRTVHVDMLPLFELNHEKDRESNKPLIITGDFSHENVLSRIKAKAYDTVFHVAALPRVSFSVKEPVLTSEVNLFKTLALFHACADSTKRVVFSSSSSVYGNTSSFPTPEATEKNPRSPYALQKLCSEKFASIFCDLYNVDIVSLRYFNVYGPHQYGDSPYATAIAAWCHCVKEGTPLRSDGDGTQVRDLTYVGDVVKANILAATCKSDIAGECFNIGSGNCNSNNHILNIFRDRFGDIVVNDAPWRPGDVMKTHANINKAVKHLGYKPDTQLQEGIQKTFEWWGI